MEFITKISNGKFNAITDVEGIEVAQYSDFKNITGATIIIAKEGAVASYDVRGAAPASFETDLLRSGMLVQKVHAIFLSGGSGDGKYAAKGLSNYLLEHKIGFKTPKRVVPIISGAAIYDFMIGNAVVPDAQSVYEICKSESSKEVAGGSVGCGTGAVVGSFLGENYVMKGGLGTCSYITEEFTIGALVVVNCYGNVYSYKDGRILAGAFDRDRKQFILPDEYFRSDNQNTPFTNTTLGVVATNIALTKEDTNKLAQMASNGLIKSIFPVNTMFDGDIVFALSTGKKNIPTNEFRIDLINKMGSLAALAIGEAIERAVIQAHSLGGVPGYKDINL